MLGELLGLDAAQLGGYEDFVALLDPAERVAVRQAFVTCATGNGRFGFDHRIRLADGNVIWVHQEAELVHGAGGGDDHVVIVTLQDLTRLHRAEETVRLLSYFDTVTGLPNRRRLAEQVSSALADPAGSAGAGVVAFRVHNFDRVVQARGHDYGNKLIVQLARRIEAELERIGQGGSIHLAHATCPRCAARRTASCRSCCAAASPPSTSRRSRTPCSRRCPRRSRRPKWTTCRPSAPALRSLEGDGADADQLVNNAHAAAELGTAPRSCAFFSPDAAGADAPPPADRVLAARRARAPRAAARLPAARRLDTFELTGVECLVRWDHPQFGTIRPEEFIAIAEESGIVDRHRPLDDRGGLPAARRRGSERYERKFFAAASVTGRQLRDPRLVTMILAAIERYRLPADALQIEVSEASLIDAPDAARAVAAGTAQPRRAHRPRRFRHRPLVARPDPPRAVQLHEARPRR